MFVRCDVPVAALGVRTAQATNRVLMPSPGGAIVRGLCLAPVSTVASDEQMDQARVANQAAAAARQAFSHARRD